MDSFEFNKFAMAVLATVFAIFGVSLVSEAIFHAEAPEEPAYTIAELDSSDSTGEAEDSGPAYEPVAPLMASADASAGENVYRKCASCHTVEQGGANKVGPNLWNIVNRPVASDSDFSYSSALTEWGGDKQWDYEHLNGFLWKPKTYVSGTAMGFAGLSDVQDRADVIAYLRTFADEPAPLPEPESEETADADTSDGDEAAAESGGSAAENGEAAAEDTEPAADNGEAATEGGESGGTEAQSSDAEGEATDSGTTETDSQTGE